MCEEQQLEIDKVPSAANFTEAQPLISSYLLYHLIESTQSLQKESFLNAYIKVVLRKTNCNVALILYLHVKFITSLNADFINFLHYPTTSSNRNSSVSPFMNKLRMMHNFEDMFDIPVEREQEEAQGTLRT